MIKISQDEAVYLRANGAGNDVHMSSRDKKSRGKRYYATTSGKAMRLIKAFRENHLVGTR